MTDPPTLASALGGATPGLMAAILDALPAEIAVLDGQGIVRVVNRAWTRFADANGASMPQVLPGADYFEVCRRASATGDTLAGEVLRARPGDASLVRRCHDIVDRQMQQMVRLLDDLLDVTRLARGHVTLRCEVVALHDVLDLAVETARPQIDQRGQHLRTPHVDPGLTLRADKARLTQVFANLLNNAARYSHPGGVIDLDVRPLAGAVEVSIRDQGIGIARSMLGGVFDLFVQAPEARRHAPGGLGIGLSLARRLVEMHGGSIRVASGGADRGSEFTVRLPLHDPALGLATAAVGLPGGAGLHARVLVVDDNADAADALALLLTTMGCDARAVHGGAAALAEADLFGPDLVLLDLGMPGLDGYATCRRLRQRPGGADTAIVAVSGWGQQQDRRRSAAAGFDDHLVKPVSADVLAQLIAARCPAGASGLAPT